MATTELTEPAPFLSGSRGAARIGWERLLLVVPLAPHLPRLVQQDRLLWLRPHYQFVPLVLIGAGVRAYAGSRDISSWRRGRRWLTALGLALDWVLLAAAELLDSPWLGSVATLGLL